MTKADIVLAIKDKANLATKAQAARTLEALLSTVEEGLAQGETITLTGFGSFKVAQRAARTGRSPQTGKPLAIPAAKVVKFSAGKKLKEAVQ